MILNTVLLLVALGYLVLYVSGRKYLESFQAASLTPSASLPTPAPASTRMAPPEKPYSKEPIDRLDDYEVSAIYQNQGTKEASKKQISDAMTRYPMDWSVQGPGSQLFQESVEGYQNEGKPASEPAPTAPAASLGSASLGSASLVPASVSDTNYSVLPDSARQEEEERKILQMYQPEKSTNLLEYSVDDVKTLVDKLYTKRGLVPELVKSKQGNNVWEVIEVKEKDPTIVWEDEAPMTAREKREVRREEVIEVPYTVSDLAAGLDPFFQKNSSVRDGRYNQWTPGLERMFAPTQPVKEWF